ncbi:putative xylanase/chitin deacetylase [Candidatus Nitrososphaera evergladensis SR1]|jgi:peptidoglycan/xylan/chitin deacetylase (PgdA/CDA1 family)|uniref:Putative xylanase/chitin deacetylase n=1 Tax=Candidatus Nitrososphaera evergladensis SR1 TaxID=1459636 RepID=A0A075MRN4_9ARCH|nr:polysaccharide deacetylase family protein [Candidatus Nitrososphaera evergladensis]AIF83823.1 putative xylanase/chitin deacetylase [Candidatus Nitrososphaera evergladensis SR1]
MRKEENMKGIAFAVAGCAMLLLATVGAAPSFNAQQQTLGEKCRCVAFRLDDIQDYYLQGTQIRLMDEFERRNLPLTVGVIGNYFGQDEKIVSFVKEGVAAGRLEVANHGWNHERFTLYSQTEQSDLMAKTNEKLNNILGFRPLIFIAPYNAVNDKTFAAAKDNAILYVSANMTFDKPPYNNKRDDGLWHYPETAETGDLSSDGARWLGYDHEKTMSEIKRGIDENGFAVVTMHPMEFALRDGLSFHDKLDEKQMQELDMLLKSINEQGYEITTLGDLAWRSESV